jgi:membrane protein implicated in regulation of membrane protease activity
MELFFLITFGIGAVYLLLMIFGGVGEALDFDLAGLFGGAAESLDGGLDLDGGNEGLGCNVIAGFLTAFGAIGLAGTVADLNIYLVLALAVIFGYAVGRLISRFIHFVYTQQSDTVASQDTLIGKLARVTISVPAGKVGEAIVEDGPVTKYPIREVNETPLKRGDMVMIVSMDGTTLNVKKKRAED